MIKVLNSRVTITNADTISCENVLPASENIIADRQNFLVHQRLETADLNHSLYSSSPMCEFSVFFFVNLATNWQSSIRA